MKTKSNSFVFIVDSYFPRDLEEKLGALGLVEDESYYSTGAGGAEAVVSGGEGNRIVDSPRLLVFMSSFHGSVTPAIELSRKIKDINPKARIIFRSASEKSGDPVFERNMQKHNYKEFLGIIKDFLAEK
jgi:hypothetical protein